MNTFEDKVKTENENFTHCHQLMGTIINMCTYVLQYESLRVHTAETIILDTQFVQVSLYNTRINHDYFQLFEFPSERIAKIIIGLYQLTFKTLVFVSVIFSILIYVIKLVTIISVCSVDQ